MGGVDLSGLGAGQKIVALERQRDLYLGLLILMICDKMESRNPAFIDSVRAEMMTLTNRADNQPCGSGFLFGDKQMNVKDVRELGRTR